MATVREADIANLNQICRLLGWTLEFYTDQQENEYRYFLQKYFSGKPMEYQQARYSAVLRGKWNDLWTQRNQNQFLPVALDYTKYSFSMVCADGNLFLCDNDAEFIAILVDEYYEIHDTNVLMRNLSFLAKFEEGIKLMRYER